MALSGNDAIAEYLHQGGAQRDGIGCGLLEREPSTKLTASRWDAAKVLPVRLSIHEMALSRTIFGPGRFLRCAFDQARRKNPLGEVEPLQRRGMRDRQTLRSDTKCETSPRKTGAEVEDILRAGSDDILCACARRSASGQK